MKIPSSIHFIWVGNPIKENYMKTILKLAQIAKSCGFTLNLWTDDARNIEKTFEKIYNQTLINPLDTLSALGVTLRFTHELDQKMNEDPFYAEDHRLRDFKKMVDSEMVGYGNYAAVSDLLRYEILRQEGGYYFDTDTIFSFNDDAKLSAHDTSVGLLVNGTIRDGLNDIYNDIIAASPNHPAIYETIKYAIEEYRKLENKTIIGFDDDQVDNSNMFQRLYKYKIGAETSFLDAKRFPHGSDTPRLPSLRRSLTLSASGPSALAEGVTRYFNHMNKNVDSSITIPSEIWKGIKHVTGRDNTWMAKEDPSKNKSYAAFNTSVLRHSLFSKPKHQDSSQENSSKHNVKEDTGKNKNTDKNNVNKPK